MTAYLILTLITGQIVPLEMAYDGCKLAAEQFKAGAAGYFELNGATVKISNMTCEVKT